MTSTCFDLLRALGALLLATALSGCFGSAPPRQRLLPEPTVEAPAPAAQAVARPLLVVRTVTLPEYLARRGIYYRAQPGELKSFNDDVWGERPAVAVTRAIAARLRVALPGYDVRAFTALADRPAAVAVLIDIEAFDALAYATPTAVALRGEWRATGAGIDRGDRFDLSTPLPALEAGAVVATMAAALDPLARSIARAIPPPVAAPSRTPG